jgi:hypothetical protein
MVAQTVSQRMKYNSYYNKILAKHSRQSLLAHPIIISSPIANYRKNDEKRVTLFRRHRSTQCEFGQTREFKDCLTWQYQLATKFYLHFWLVMRISQLGVQYQLERGIVLDLLVAEFDSAAFLDGITTNYWVQNWINRFANVFNQNGFAH